MQLFIEISEVAEFDLEDIFDYTDESHGDDQAFEYVSSFDDLFEKLITHPKMGRTRPEIREGLRSIVKGYHVVFYRIMRDRIRIVRILHGSRDLPNQFKGYEKKP